MCDIISHKISNDLHQYIKNKYNIDLENDSNISIQSYNENTCFARLCKRNSDYIDNYGYFTTFQCNCSKFSNSDLCELHLNKFKSDKLSLGLINQPPPQEPYIFDLLGNKTRIYWLKDSPDEKLKEFVEEKEEIQRTQNYKKNSRGRPPLPKIKYDSQLFKDMIKENNLHKINIQSLKQYCIKNNIHCQGNKSDICCQIYKKSSPLSIL